MRPFQSPQAYNIVGLQSFATLLALTSTLTILSVSRQEPGHPIHGCYDTALVEWFCLLTTGATKPSRSKMELMVADNIPRRVHGLSLTEIVNLNASDYITTELL